MSNLIAALFTFLLGPPETCNSTFFGTPGDKWAGGDALYLRRPINDRDVGIAHRSLKLGSAVVIVHARTGLFTVAQVVDRGPYGAIHPDGHWYVKKRKAWPGKWRGCADLTPRTARLIGHDGWDRVHVFPVPWT